MGPQKSKRTPAGLLTTPAWPISQGDFVQPIHPKASQFSGGWRACYPVVNLQYRSHPWPLYRCFHAIRRSSFALSNAPFLSICAAQVGHHSFPHDAECTTGGDFFPCQGVLHVLMRLTSSFASLFYHCSHPEVHLQSSFSVYILGLSHNFQPDINICRFILPRPTDRQYSPGWNSPGWSRRRGRS